MGPNMTNVPDEWQNLSPILSVQEVASLLGVHENTVKKWISDKTLKAFKQGRVIRVYRSDFFKFAGIDEDES